MSLGTCPHGIPIERACAHCEVAETIASLDAIPRTTCRELIVRAVLEAWETVLLTQTARLEDAPPEAVRDAEAIADRLLAEAEKEST